MNEGAKAFAKQFGDVTLMAMLKIAEDKKWYGEATHMNSSGVPIAIFNFQAGECKRWNPITWFDQRNVFKGSEVIK
jgi:hypothetical protein